MKNDIDTIFKRYRPALQHRSKPGAEPGTVVVHPDLALLPVKIFVVAYNETELLEKSIEDIDEVQPLLEKFPLTWVNVSGLGNLETLEKVTALFELNKLAMEDVVNVHQRPKVEEYDDIFFAVATEPDIINNELVMQQISMFWGANFVLTFQEHESDCYEPLFARIKHGGRRQRLSRPDYLAYAILDAVIDNFFPMLELYGTQLDDIEESAIDNASTVIIRHIHNFKHDLHMLRRAAWGLREAMASFRELAVVSNSDLRFFIRDCEDHTIQLIEILESYRERTSGLMDIYLSSVNNRTNRIMKVLTIVAATFMPIGVLAGIYGMNFDRSKPWNMPELSWEYGYAYFWCLAILIAGSMLTTFWRKGWFKH
jgi:magnesium transporter